VLLTTILWATIGSGLILAGYYYYYFNAVMQSKTPEINQALEPVTLLICVKDNIKQVKQNLASWCEQNFPDYEVIIIDDHSTDGLSVYLETMQPVYPNLCCYPAPDGIKDAPGKKAALQFGLLQARSPWILMTDADCKPSSTLWIQQMMDARSQPKTQCVLGYSPLQKTASLLSRWMTFETSWVAIQYLGFARKGEAYMGVGRNLLIKRDIALTAELHLEIASGDDDFLVQAVKPNCIDICIHPQAWTRTSAPDNWTSWWKRKTRHSQTAFIYPGKIRLKLALISASLGIYYLGLITLLLTWHDWWTVMIWILCTMTVLPVRYPLIRKLEIPRFTWWWAEPLLVLAYGLVGFRMLFQSRKTWN